MIPATPADFVTALKNDILGIRMAQCSTVDITGNQIVSLT